MLRAGGHHETSLVDTSRQSAASNAHVYAWDYDQDGKNWKEGTCAKAEGQSPIDISKMIAAKVQDKDYFFFNYPVYEAPLKMVNDGRFLYAEFPNKDGRVGGMAFGQSYPNQLTVAYDLYKMVIHTPSEHTFGGKQVPLEVQLYHRKHDAPLQGSDPAAVDTAVVAVGFAESRDEASPFLRSLIDGGLPDKRGETTLVNRAYPSALRFSELFKPVFGAQGEKAGFWDYTGSLTQPPCETGVRWLVKDEPLNAKKKTLKYFKDVVKKSSGGVPSNARLVQNAAGNDGEGKSYPGQRPIYPRFARNAVHMTVFNPKRPKAFKDAVARALENQKNFQKALKDDQSGSADAIADGASPSEAVLASQKYRKCTDTMGTIHEDMMMAETKMKNECNAAKGATDTMKDISGGPARTEAATKGAALKKSCDDDKKVWNAKKTELANQKSQCETIEKDIRKKHGEAEETNKKADAPSKKKSE